MVNTGLMHGKLPFDPEVALAIHYAPSAVREALTALWAFDAQLAQILRSTTDPMIGQMRLTWWHEAVGRPDPVAGEPVLAGLANASLTGPVAQRIVEGWEALLDEPDEMALTAFAEGRGGGLFAAAAHLLGASQPVEDAGAGWALVDLARHHSQPAVAERALALAKDRLTKAPSRWERAGRPLGALAKLTRRDLREPERQGSPRRILAIAWLALTGR